MYYFQRTVAMDFDQVLVLVKEALQKEGMGVMTEMDLQRAFRQKLNQDFRRYHVLGACHPQVAFDMLQVDGRAAVMFPCNVVIQECADYGGTGIAYIAAPVLPDPMTGQRRYSYAAAGRWVTWAKAAFEHYFMIKMRLGLGLPWFEKLGIRLLFGLALSQPAPAHSLEQPMQV